jgi:hypothetical protein
MSYAAISKYELFLSFNTLGFFMTDIATNVEIHGVNECLRITVIPFHIGKQDKKHIKPYKSAKRKNC